MLKFCQLFKDLGTSGTGRGSWELHDDAPKAGPENYLTLPLTPKTLKRKKVGDVYSFLSVLIQKVMNAVLLDTIPSTLKNQQHLRTLTLSE